MHSAIQEAMARKPATTRKRSKASGDDVAYYVVEISDWDWSFSFGVGWRRDIDRGPYSDYRHLAVKGKLLRPSTIKADGAELTFLPSPDLNASERSRDEPKAVGSFQIHDRTFKPLLEMPADALAPVLQMLIAGKFRYVVMNGGKPHYRQGSIRSYRFEMTVSDDDLPAEE